MAYPEFFYKGYAPKGGQRGLKGGQRGEVREEKVDRPSPQSGGLWNAARQTAGRGS